MLSGRWTKALARGLRGDERGQVMILALVIMGLSGLVLAPTLEYVATGAKAAETQRKLTKALYAADAGVENAMYRIGDGMTAFTETITVGGIPVDITVTSLTELPYGPVITGGAEHADWIVVTTELVDLGGDVWSMTAHITNTAGNGNVKLEAIGAGRPKRFDYLPGTASGVTTRDPNVYESKLIWPFFGDERPTLLDGDSVTQTYRITGDGEPRRYYTWVTASRDDIGTVSSSTGYNVVSVAAGTRIEANVVKNETYVYPVSWEISRSGT